jgi:hypothetical protein
MLHSSESAEHVAQRVVVVAMEAGVKYPTPATMDKPQFLRRVDRMLTDVLDSQTPASRPVLATRIDALELQPAVLVSGSTRLALLVGAPADQRAADTM